jgi:hypothetical protein
MDERRLMSTLIHREANGVGGLSQLIRKMAGTDKTKSLKEKTLTAKGRKHIKKSNFALPGGRYPIHDISHARNALARVAQHGSPDEQKKVKAAVHRKYPSLAGECGESLKTNQPFKLIETLTDVAKNEGPIVKCVLITSGLGNRNQMNYYSVEAIQKGAALFEGKPCFLDHMAESEQVERPERSVKEKCGYFKNVRPEAIDGNVGLVGELHFDLSESGKMAYQKALTAIHYKGEFPTSEAEYVGLSINANGLREKRTVQVGDEMLEVNYVTEFTDVGSIDEVTTPARGGRFLATLVESAAGAILKRKETQTMIVKSLKAALTALTEASKDEKISEELKTKLTEAENPLKSLLKEAMKCAEEEAEEESEGYESKGDGAKGEESEDEDDGEKGGDGAVKPGHTITKTVKVKHDGPSDDEKDDDDDDAQESKRGYLKALLIEAKVPKKLWNLDRLTGLPLKEAKSIIEEKKALLESVQEAVKEQEFVPVENGGGSFQESERSNETLSGIFAGLAG